MSKDEKIFDKEEKVMAVSKCVLGCITGEAGIRLIEDIKKAKLNTQAEKACDELLERLKKGEFKKQI